MVCNCAEILRHDAFGSGMDLIWQGIMNAVGLLARGDLPTWRIAALSLTVSGVSTLLAALAGVPLGAVLALQQFHGRWLLMNVVHTRMGLPPVVVGLGCHSCCGGQVRSATSN